MVRRSSGRASTIKPAGYYARSPSLSDDSESGEPAPRGRHEISDSGSSDFDESGGEEDEEEDVGVGHEVVDPSELGSGLREPTKKSKRVSTVPVKTPEQLAAERREQLWPEARQLAWALAHPPRKAFKPNGRELERAWMNKLAPWAFRNNNNRMQVSGDILLYVRRVTKTDPFTRKPVADWDDPAYGANDLNLNQDYAKWLLDDGLADARMAHPLDIRDRQRFRCDETFGEHQHHAGRHDNERHQNDHNHHHHHHHRSGTACIEPPSEHARLHERGAPDVRLTYDFSKHAFVFCGSCADRQEQHLSAKAAQGHAEGALFPLCAGCALAALRDRGSGWAGCACDAAPRCLAHRVAHLERLADAHDAYADAHPVPCAADDDQLRSDDGAPLLTPACPACRANPPPAEVRGAAFAFMCVECGGTVVLPRAGEQWRRGRAGALQRFVRELPEPDYWDGLTDGQRREIEERNARWDAENGKAARDDGQGGEEEEDDDDDDVGQQAAAFVRARGLTAREARPASSAPAPASARDDSREKENVDPLGSAAARAHPKRPLDFPSPRVVKVSANSSGTPTHAAAASTITNTVPATPSTATKRKRAASPASSITTVRPSPSPPSPSYWRAGKGGRSAIEDRPSSDGEEDEGGKRRKRRKVNESVSPPKKKLGQDGVLATGVLHEEEGCEENVMEFSFVLFLSDNCGKGTAMIL